MGIEGLAENKSRWDIMLDRMRSSAIALIVAAVFIGVTVMLATSNCERERNAEFRSEMRADNAEMKADYDALRAEVKAGNTRVLEALDRLENSVDSRLNAGEREQARMQGVLSVLTEKSDSVDTP